MTSKTPIHQETQGLATQQHRLVGHWVHHQLHCSIRGVLSYRLAVEDLAEGSTGNRQLMLMLHDL